MICHSFQTKLYIELRYPDFVNSLDIMKKAQTRLEDLVLNVLSRYRYTDDTSPVLLGVSFLDEWFRFIQKTGVKQGQRRRFFPSKSEIELSCRKHILPFPSPAIFLS